VSAVPRMLVAVCVAALMCVAARADGEFPGAVPGYSIVLPRDEGSHPQFRTEWWYLTGWLEDDEAKQFGFQVTFFRHRPGIDKDNPSRFAAKQLLFAHASLSDPNQGKLLRDEKSARTGFGLAEAREGELAVHIDDWQLTRRAGSDEITTSIATETFRFDLSLRVAQPPLMQGNKGFSQKGPAVTSASYYYSLPQLIASGTVISEGREYKVRGVAWLDHEWFSSVLDDEARGWDWAGLNLDDGSSLMVFRMRNAAGAAHWAAATLRDRDRNVRTYSPSDIQWKALRQWRSARTGVEYPVEWQVSVGGRTMRLRPLMDDQENDARGSTGTLYWEGAVQVFDDGGRAIGRGYLELTGYGDRIRF
jgi:predicted secreted hydrolase